MPSLVVTKPLLILVSPGVLGEALGVAADAVDGARDESEATRAKLRPLVTTPRREAPVKSPCADGLLGGVVMGPVLAMSRGLGDRPNSAGTLGRFPARGLDVLVVT